MEHLIINKYPESKCNSGCFLILLYIFVITPLKIFPVIGQDNNDGLRKTIR